MHCEIRANVLPKNVGSTEIITEAYPGAGFARKRINSEAVFLVRKLISGETQLAVDTSLHTIRAFHLTVN